MEIPKKISGNNCISLKINIYKLSKNEMCIFKFYFFRSILKIVFFFFLRNNLKKETKILFICVIYKDNTEVYVRESCLKTTCFLVVSKTLISTKVTGPIVANNKTVPESKNCIT